MTILDYLLIGVSDKEIIVEEKEGIENFIRKDIYSLHGKSYKVLTSEHYLTVNLKVYDPCTIENGTEDVMLKISIVLRDEGKELSFADRFFYDTPLGKA